MTNPTGPLVVTKTDLRDHIARTIRASLASGVPEDGIAEMLAQWVAAHLTNGTRIESAPPLTAPTHGIADGVEGSAIPMKSTAANPKRLTKPQLRELKRLAVQPQNTFGAQRTRVQNSLAWARLARFLDIDGKDINVCNWMGMKNLTNRCEITDAGRRALEAHTNAPKARRRTSP